MTFQNRPLIPGGKGDRANALSDKMAYHPFHEGSALDHYHRLGQIAQQVTNARAEPPGQDDRGDFLRLDVHRTRFFLKR